jgi:hypothetical protein
MDEQTKVVSALNKAIKTDSFEDHVGTLVSLQAAAMAETDNATIRLDTIKMRAQAFFMICAEVWKCSYHEAVQYAEEIIEGDRYDPDGNNIYSSMPYREYLQTAHWRGVREYALMRADYRCQLCNSPESLQVHHRTYDRRGRENYRDVVALCRNCHARFHDK